MNRIARILPVLCIPVAGCTGYVWVEKEIPPSFNHKFIKTIAVPEFLNRSKSPDAGKIAADRIEELLVNESPYKVVTRMEIERIVEELKLSVKGYVDPKTINKLGRVAGVDALVLGTVEAWDFEEKKGLAHLKRNATVAVTMKLVDSTTGRVVWSKRSSGRYFKQYLRVQLALSRRRLISPRECIEKAMDDVAADARAMFPRKKKVRVRLEEAQ